jgi:hypothetical protein
MSAFVKNTPKSFSALEKPTPETDKKGRPSQPEQPAVAGSVPQDRPPRNPPISERFDVV